MSKKNKFYDMAVLNKYIEDRNYNLVEEAGDFTSQGNVHSSRLLNPKVFSLAETPIFEDGMINVGSLATVSKTYPFLSSFGNHIKDMVDYLTKKMNGEWYIESYKLNKGSQEVISGINIVRGKLSEDLAVITEYIVRHFPEDAKIIEKDWTRKNPYNWIGIIEENGESLFDYGFDNIECDDEGGTDLVFLPHHDDFTPKDIQVSEQQFITRVNRLASSASKVNFAVESACLILNLLNYKFYKYELEEFEIDPDLREPYLEELKQPIETSSGSPYCTRWFEAIFRNRRYTHKSKVPTHVDYYMDYNESSLPYFNFIKDQVKPYSNDLIEALLVLKTHNTSIGFKGRQLEKLKKVAEFYDKFLAARKTVINWYSTRFTEIDDKEMEAAMSFLLSKFDEVKALIDVRSKINMTLFVADQRVVSNAKRNGEELPALSEIKTELDAVEKLGPHLKKLGLKIVPIDQEEYSATKHITENLSTQDMDRILKVRNVMMHAPNIMKQVPTDISVKAWVPQSTPPAVSNVSASIVNSKEVKNESTSEFDQGFEYNQKLKRWKNTETFKSFYKKLGDSGECTVTQIGLVKSNKDLITDTEAAERVRIKEEGGKVIRGNKMTQRSAANSGNKFIKEANLLPCQNFKNLSRSDAVLKVFETAYKSKNKIVGKSTKANDAKALLSKDKDFLVTPDKVLAKHLEKLKVTQKQQTKYLELVDEIEGTIEGKSSVKYNTEQVAIAFCEGQRNQENSSQ